MEENPYQAPVDVTSFADRRKTGHRFTHAARREHRLQWVVALPILAVQLIVCVVLAFGDIGFDHPGHYGLDFDDFLFLIAVQLGLTVLSIGLVLWRRRWAMLPVPLLIAILTAVAVTYGD